MGNSSSDEGKDDEKELQACFLILCDATKTQAEKRASFQRLREAYVPDTSQGSTYSDELQRVFGIRYSVWKDVRPDGDYADFASPRLNTTVIDDSIRGCIFGAALGDATGLATEFLTKAAITEHYGHQYDFSPRCDDVYADAHRVSFPAGDWTDDTDQMILVLISLLETGGRAVPQNFAEKMLQWRDCGFPGLGDSGGTGLGKSTKSVLQSPDFERDPLGTATVVWERSGKKMAPNGAVMRTAVTGIPFFWNLEVVEANTVAICRSTHADPRCVASCVLVANIVTRVLRRRIAMESSHSRSDSQPSQPGDVEAALSDTDFADLDVILQDSIDRAATYLDTDEQVAELLSFTDPSNTLVSLKLGEPTSIGYTYKCLASALVTLRQFREVESFEESIRALVREGGDADTNATVAGALLGCFVGHRNLPDRWMKEMPYEVWLDAWVQKLIFMVHSSYSMEEETHHVIKEGD